MPKIPDFPAAPAKSKSKTGKLALLLGPLAAAGLLVSLPEDEGTRNHAYRDIVGVWTICTGDTKNVRPGQVATDAECQDRLERQLVAHAEPVMNCVPTLKEAGRDYQRWAAVSLAYNIGTGGLCRSSVARLFNARQWRAGCDAILKWNRARGREIRGLTLRRQRERAICLKGL